MNCPCLNANSLGRGGAARYRGYQARIAADDPRVADQQVQRVLRAIARLVEFPRLGREGRISGTRELIVSRTPYLVAYRIIGDTIHILRVLHGRQRWPERL
ncbi:MAG: type II toxin-antitoxin system RelE/ParE family toxin [Alphaproteobacteria bacterium]|nr:MAG: type II toxin-antitoxin system RelE/ParE family toxin [Alphaproteobacteria bacterium]